MSIRVLVCGGRKYNDREKVFSVLDKLHLERFIYILSEGGAGGADNLAAHWAKLTHVSRCTFHADWVMGKSAGPIRNSRMLEVFNPDLVVAFPGGTGTADMVRKSKVAGVEVMEIE